MSGSISSFFTDVGNELEEAISDVANEIGDAADDVRNEVDGNNNAAATTSTAAPSTAAPSTTAPTTNAPSTTTTATATPATDGRDAPVARLYEAAFDRAPDDAGLAFWTNAQQAGAGLNTIADFFVASPEFQSRYGNLGTGQFVDRLYLNALDREADPAGRAFWTAGIESRQVDRGDVLLAFAQSPEFVARTGTNDPLI